MTGLSFGILIAEVILRLIIPKVNVVTEADTKHYHWHKANMNYVFSGYPGNVKEFTIRGRWNSYGFNDVEHSFKKSNKYRIVNIGDSFVEAQQVPMDRNFGVLLGQKLNVEVVNMGRSADGMVNASKAIPFALKYSPDLIMIFFCSNDLVNDYDVLQNRDFEEREMLRPFSSICFRPDNYTSKSRVVQFLGQKVNEYTYRNRVAKAFPGFRSVNLQMFDPVMSAEFAKAWEISLAAILNAKKTSEASGVKFVLVLVADLLQLRPAANEFDPGKLERILAVFSKQNGINFIAMRNTFIQREAETDTRPFWKYDGHWNETGHVWVSEILESYIGRKFK